MANLGRMHYLGRGVPRDPNKALDVWLLAADQGCRVSCTNAAALLARKAADDPAEAVLALEAFRTVPKIAIRKPLLADVVGLGEGRRRRHVGHGGQRDAGHGHGRDRHVGAPLLGRGCSRHSA